MENINCQLVVFSDRAYNAIIRETLEFEPNETGGILLGHILDNGCWIVMEVLPPGYGEGREGNNVFHDYAYFEYNQRFVNYLAQSVATQYEIPLELLGLWHRHPGSMNVFSGTDDGTNRDFAMRNPQGVISGLINVDPDLRMTMYYLSHSAAQMPGRPAYVQVEVEVGSDLIPEQYFRLKYFNGTVNNPHPHVEKSNAEASSTSASAADEQSDTHSGFKMLDSWMATIKKNKVVVLVVAVVLLLCFISFIPGSHSTRYIRHGFIRPVHVFLP